MPATVVVSPSSKSRIRSLYRRWFTRWGTVCADSFNRLNEEGLGNADTGHDWSEFQDGASSTAFWIRSGKARAASAAASVDNWAMVDTGLSDVCVRVVVKTPGTLSAAHNYGIVFRLSDLGVGLYFGFNGATNSAKLMNFSSGVGASIATATFAWVAATEYVLEERAVADALSLRIDGVEVIAATNATGQTNTRHGIECEETIEALFDNFFVRRAN